jgi:hypothetical protein
VKINTDQAISVLCALYAEDRTEVRLIRKNITSTITSFVIASFAITAFPSEIKPPNPSLRFYIILVDVLVMLMMGFAFWLLKVDLGWARRNLEAREKLI